MSPRVTVYSRPGCHLCEVALGEIRSISGIDFELDVVDIDADDDLLSRYLERIPVVEIDGEELYEFQVDASDLAVRLKGAGGR